MIYVDLINGLTKYLLAQDILPVELPNIPYSGVRPFLRASVLPVPVDSRGPDGYDLHQGIFQVDVVVDSKVGPVEAARYVEQVLPAFPRNLRIDENDTTIRIDSTGSPAPAIQETKGYFVPVSIQYTVLD